MSLKRKGKPANPDAHHVYPVGDVREHWASTECWCGPKLQKPCGQCDASEDGCPLCDKGFTEATAGEATLIIHRAADGRE